MHCKGSVAFGVFYNGAWLTALLGGAHKFEHAHAHNEHFGMYLGKRHVADFRGSLSRYVFNTTLMI